MKCKCGGEYEPVAFNCDLPDGTELYDCICNNCGAHCILSINNEKEINKDDN